MSLENSWQLGRLPRDRLEDLALRAALEVKSLRQQHAPNRYFAGVCVGFAAGALFSAAGFITGALLR